MNWPLEHLQKGWGKVAEQLKFNYPRSGRFFNLSCPYLIKKTLKVVKAILHFWLLTFLDSKKRWFYHMWQQVHCHPWTEPCLLHSVVYLLSLPQSYFLYPKAYNHKLLVRSKYYISLVLLKKLQGELNIILKLIFAAFHHTWGPGYF